MSLASPVGRAPFQSARRASSAGLPEHVVYWEPWPRRMRAMLDGRTVVDTRDAVILWESGTFTSFLYPRHDIDDLLDIGLLSDGPTSNDGAELLAGYVRVAFDAMDMWFEEDDPIYAHPRDPYHRVDVLSSSRRIVVRVGDTVIAQTSRPKLLFETGLPTRYYIPRADIDERALSRSETVSQCPYKGDGQHWNLSVGDDIIADAAWSLPHPRPEAVTATNHVCFYPDKVSIEVDGRTLDTQSAAETP